MRISDWSSDVCSSDLHRERPAYASPSELSVRPKSFSLRCRADRSIPMKAAVRERLPEKRLIWIRRYSRPKFSRASFSGIAVNDSELGRISESGRANGSTPVTNEHIVTRLPRETKNKTTY